MKYLLKRNSEDKGVLCEKEITTNGTEVYVIKDDDRSMCQPIGVCLAHKSKPCDKCGRYQGRKVIATNNTSMDLPKVVDEVNLLAKKTSYERYGCINMPHIKAYKEGHNKSQSTHDFTADDADAYADAVVGGCLLRAKEWKSQQPKVIYYE